MLKLSAKKLFCRNSAFTVPPLALGTWMWNARSGPYFSTWRSNNCWSVYGLIAPPFPASCKPCCDEWSQGGEFSPEAPAYPQPQRNPPSMSEHPKTERSSRWAIGARRALWKQKVERRQTVRKNPAEIGQLKCNEIAPSDIWI
jgi:hypothetical protein